MCALPGPDENSSRTWTRTIGHSSDDPPVCLDILNIGHEEENGSLFPSLSYASIHDESQQMEEGMDRTECTDPSDKPAEPDSYSGPNCRKKLLDKPKMFFIQACQLFCKDMSQEHSGSHRKKMECLYVCYLYSRHVNKTCPRHAKEHVIMNANIKVVSC